MAHIHVDILQAQSSKRPGTPCGDLVAYDRSPSATTLVLCDGLGSGVKANVAATMCTARLLEGLRGGASLRQVFGRLVSNMVQVRASDLSDDGEPPYACFSIVRILNDGQATVLTYEMPQPVFVTTSHVTPLPQRIHTIENALVGETQLQLAPGDGLVVVSDGVTQAGLGLSQKLGWRVEGMQQYLAQLLSERCPLRELPQALHDRARALWEGVGGDDVTVAMALCRWGNTLSILTGPPSSRAQDREVAHRFMLREGWKVIAGSTTAEIVADYLGLSLETQQDVPSHMAPPRYYLDGVDLVSEGAVTLNQVYNVLEEDPDVLEEDTGVAELQRMLRDADRIHFVVGVAHNPAHGDIFFRQRGLLTRSHIVDLLAEKLERLGKLVTIEHV